MGRPRFNPNKFQKQNNNPSHKLCADRNDNPRGTNIGQIETIFADGAIKIDEAAVAATIASKSTALLAAQSAERVKQILQDLTLTVPVHEKQAYLNLITSNHDIFSVNKNDLGRANNFTHSIDLKNKAAWRILTRQHWISKSMNG